jgi:hypothetical protein
MVWDPLLEASSDANPPTDSSPRTKGDDELQ